MKVNETVYFLEEGDSIYIKANTEHSFKNLSANPCISYWTYDGTHREMFEDNNNTVWE